MKKLRLIFNSFSFLFLLASSILNSSFAAPAVPTTLVVTEDGRLEFESPGSVLGESETTVSGRPESGNLQLELGVARIKLERTGGDIQLKLESESGETVETLSPTGPDLLKIRPRSSELEVRVGSLSAGRLFLSRRRLGAMTKLPISLNLDTNQLLVSTPAGSKVVAVLPDQAVENLWREKFLDKVGQFSVEEILSQASPSSELSSSMELLMDDEGKLVYEIKGRKTEKLLGLIPVTISRTAIVSAQTGAVEKVEESIFSRFLSLISL